MSNLFNSILKRNGFILISNVDDFYLVNQKEQYFFVFDSEGAETESEIVKLMEKMYYEYMFGGRYITDCKYQKKYMLEQLKNLLKDLQKRF